MKKSSFIFLFVLLASVIQASGQTDKTLKRIDDVPNDVSVDIFFNGGEVAQPVTAFLAAAINVVNDNYHRIRLKAGYKYLNIPISLSSSSFQATIAAPLLQNQTRNKVVTISYIFANYDNRFNIPVEWEEV